MKRGQSGISAVFGIDKPKGMTSHDVVNRVRRICGERRVGHAGTLDPAASGVLPIMVGPATRMSEYLTGHTKSYTARISFGSSTTTDDAEGDVLQRAVVPEKVADISFAHSLLEVFLGDQSQIPPQYSAIKTDGKRAYDQARKGETVALKPREITVMRAQLVALVDNRPHEEVYWEVEFDVSAGTYIRSLARDIGVYAGTCAHLSDLRRTRVGTLQVSECVSLEVLEEMGLKASLDPVKLLDYPLCFPQGKAANMLSNGASLPVADLEFFTCTSSDHHSCNCFPDLSRMTQPLSDATRVSMVVDNELKAISCYQQQTGMLAAECVFPIGVNRGEYI